MSETGIADIELKIGMEWLQHSPYHLETYLGIVIPTGNKPAGEFLFEPIVGNGHHWGFISGSCGGMDMQEWEERNWLLRIEYAIHTQYLFQNKQVRSLDLKNKPWSRYMEMYKNESQAQQARDLGLAAVPAFGPGVIPPNKPKNLATPGINLLTLPVKVEPGFANNITTSFVFTTGSGFLGEFGYNLYAKSAECVKLACPWNPGPALKHAAGSGLTNPARNITGDYRLDDGGQVLANIGGTGPVVENYAQNQISEKDLDLVSAAHPTAIAHIMYASIGYQSLDHEFPLFFTLGASYEWPNSTNASIERWTVWGKLGLAF